jgi:dTDP-4-amino-4,6-dideoxygalactose transaminase
MIPVTKPFLPPREEYDKFLDGIWERNWLTNNGPLVNELESKLKDYLGIENLLFLSNGTIAIQIAIKALGLKGEIITTPFSYVATTSSIVWEGCEPVFVDIDPFTLNIDPNKIEDAITKNTSAILATHVYGNPCDIDKIDVIAKKHNIKVIYDAAHCFGTKFKGKSVFSYGDIVTTSFHATKLFHTIEGGAVFSKDPSVLRTMEYMRNFGHDGPEKFQGVGINGKNSEFHAAMGLTVLNYISQILDQRKELCLHYKKVLKHRDISNIQCLEGSDFNYAYFPIILPDEKSTLRVVEVLNKHLIYPRRYFYPSLSKLDYVTENQNTPVCDSVSQRVLCLPLYHTLSKVEIDLIAGLILKALK